MKGTDMTEEYQQKTFKPSNSVPIRTKAKLLAETEWTTGKGSWMLFAVYETRGGAYIAVIEGSIPEKPDQIERTVVVVEPISKLLSDHTHQLDQTAMQIAVIEAFGGHDRAKKMLKGELGWAPVRVVA